MGNICLYKREHDEIKYYKYIKRLNDNEFFVVLKIDTKTDYNTKDKDKYMYHICDSSFRILYNLSFYYDNTLHVFNTFHVFNNSNNLIITRDFLTNSFTRIDNKFCYTNETIKLIDILKMEGIYCGVLPFNDTSLGSKILNIYGYFCIIKYISNSQNYKVSYIYFAKYILNFDYFYEDNILYIFTKDIIYKIQDNPNNNLLDDIYSLNVTNFNPVGFYNYNYIVLFDELGNTKFIDKLEINIPTKLSGFSRIITL